MTLRLSVGLVNQIGQYISDTPSGTELEVRFGTFEENRFLPGISYAQFNHVLNRLHSEHESSQIQLLTVTEKIRGDYRETIDTEGTISYMLKQRVEPPINVTDYNFRIAKATEQDLGTTKPSNLPKKIDLTRRKQRTSFLFPTHKIDMTSVDESGKGHRYEIEIEYLTQVDVKGIFEPVKKVIKLIQNSEYIMSQYDINRVIDSYNALIHKDIEAVKQRNPHFTLPHGTLYSIQSKPINLKKRYLMNLSHDYSVTDKANGVRYLLLIIETGLYLLNPPCELRKLTEAAPKDLLGTLIDGELVMNLQGTQELYLAFDILYYKEQDIKLLDLIQRIQRISKISSQVDKALPKQKFRVKKFFYGKDFYTSVEDAFKHLEKLDYENDGLILTPLREPYINNKIYKWKPKELLTIDFRLCKADKDKPDIYYLQVYTKATWKGCKITSANYQVFQGSKYHPYNRTVQLTGMNHGQIVEFGWNYTKGDFVVHRIRNDKIIPNHFKIAQDVWADIFDPIDKDVLTGNSTVMMRKWHNIIKEQMLNNLHPDIEVIVDIGSGRGADILKWKNRKFEHVYAIDPNEKNNQEFLERLKVLEYTGHVSLIKGYAQNTEHILSVLPRKHVQAVISFFSLSFFTCDEKTLDSLLNTVDALLEPGQPFIGTTIDGARVVKLLGDKDEFVRPYFTIKKEYHDKDINGDSIGYGKQIIITLKDTMVEDQIECLVDFDNFANKMIVRGYDLVENNYFPVDQVSYLSKDQKILSSLFRSFAFIKKPSLTVAPPHEQTALPPPVEKKEYADVLLKEYKEEEPVVEVSESTSSSEPEPGPELTILQPGQREPLETPIMDNIVRVGTVADGSCLFHSILEAKSKEYRSMDKSERITYAAKIRKQLAKRLTHEQFEELGNGILANNLYTIEARKLLESRYTKGKKPIFSKKEFYLMMAQIMGQDMTLEDMKHAVEKSIEEHGQDSTEATNIFDRVPLLVFKKYKATLSDCSKWVGTEIVEYLSNTLKLDIYFVDGDTRLPYKIGSDCDKLYQGRKSVVILYVAKMHYEVLSRNNIMLFKPDDPLIKKLYQIQCG